MKGTDISGGNTVFKKTTTYFLFLHVSLSPHLSMNKDFYFPVLIIDDIIIVIFSLIIKYHQ